MNLVPTLETAPSILSSVIRTQQGGCIHAMAVRKRTEPTSEQSKMSENIRKTNSSLF